MVAARTAMALGTGKHKWLDNLETLEDLSRIQTARNRVHRLGIEPWRRWAGGFWCFFFVWVGVPFSIWMRSADHWTSFGMCFMPILLIYFPVYAVGLDHAKDGSWPAASVWLANIVLLAVGAYWLRRIHKG
jgi:lipopolysaccharide export system permease protein